MRSLVPAAVLLALVASADAQQSLSPHQAAAMQLGQQIGALSEQVASLQEQLAAARAERDAATKERDDLKAKAAAVKAEPAKE